ncbi:putative ATP-dependent RNA helicase DHX57 [Chironomus tepperi]|uniref:putative ATP-dependent RNA helicase DHX57 n=1 Tax=Chironomus tepperi TaxID=113505 RepID=UPI00391F8ED8
MDGESKALISDCFLRTLPSDVHSTNGKKEAPEPKNPPHKTEMQVLSLREETQNMIEATLKNIHGDNFEFSKLDDYEHKHSKIKGSYWKEKGELVIKGGSDYSGLVSEGREGKMKMYALLKLESYGFEVRHALEVLNMFEDNVDDSINFLYGKYFPAKRKVDDESQTIELSTEERHEQMNDELESLKSIFHDEIQEIEKHSIWQFQLRLDYLLKFSPSEEKKADMKKKLEMEAHFQELQRLKQKKKKNTVEKCRNVLEKGKCKYGTKCKFSHDIYRDDADNADGQNSSKQSNKKTDTSEEERKTWILEIRFPKWCFYPSQAPIILLRNKIGDISKSICLRINQRLIDESRELAKDQIPSIYSVVDLLKNEEEILNFLKKADSFYTYPSCDISIFDYDPDNLNGNSNDSEDEDLPTHYEMGKVDKFDKQALSDDEILKENLKLVKRYNEKLNTPAYKKMLDGRKNLPTWSMRNEILRVIRENQVCIISGETGSGKSTQTPQFILDEWLEKSTNTNKPENVEIIVTQPRRIATIGVAERISDERCEKIGSIVGYQIRLENKISTSTRLTFCTTGILLRRLYSDPLLNSINYVIIDEVHERSEESDFLLLILKGLLEKRKDLKIILMSATLNAKLFSDYFNGAPVINIQGRTFPVRQIFLEDILEMTHFVMEADSQYCKKLSKKDEEALLQELEYMDIQANANPPPRSVRDENLSLSDLLARYKGYSKTTCKSLFMMDHFKINPELIESVLNYIIECDNKDWPRDGSILIFLPGLGEIQSVYDALMDSKNFGPRTDKFVIIPLHSSLSSEDQSMIFRKFNKKRKIILSTNIAETSVTIDDVVFVIDCGQHKEKHFDNNRNMESLETSWISRANCSQRKGRAGRVMAGICFHIFTKHRHDNNFLAQPIPEIHRIPLEQLLLRIKILNNFHGKKIHDVLSKCIEPPTMESAESAIKRLQNLGAFEKENLTPLGSHLALLPVDVRIGKLMLFGAIFQCLDSVLTICASLSHKSPFVSPFTKRQEANAKKRQFSIANSDHLTVLNAYKKWKEACKKSRYAGQVYVEENYLSLKTLETIGEMKYQFLELLISIGFVPIDLPKKQKGRVFDDNVFDITGKILNANSDNSRLISGILCASLYPNIIKILTPEKNYVATLSGAMPRSFQASELKFKTKEDGYVALHPSSVNSSSGVFQSPFLIYQEKVKTSRIFIRDCTMVQIIPLILFSGSDIRIELHNGEFLFLLEDGWLIVQADSLKTAECMKHMRKELMNILNEKIKDPLLNLWNHDQGKRVISTIIHLLTKE